MFEEYTGKNYEKMSKVIGNTSYYLALMFMLGSVILFLRSAFYIFEKYTNPFTLVFENIVIMLVVPLFFSSVLLYFVLKNNKIISKEFMEINGLKSVFAFWSSILVILLMIACPILYFLSMIEFGGCGGDWFGCIEYYGPAAIGAVIAFWIGVYLLFYQFLEYKSQKA